MTPKKTPKQQLQFWPPEATGEPPRLRTRKTRKDIYRNDLREEIALLREVLFNVAELGSQTGAPDEMLKLLDKISQACTRLGTLLKTNLQLSPADDLTQAFNQALEIVNDPVKLQAYLSARDEQPGSPASGG